eukprot:6584134-Prymnesium_polylepis.1
MLALRAQGREWGDAILEVMPRRRGARPHRAGPQASAWRPVQASAANLPRGLSPPHFRNLALGGSRSSDRAPLPHGGRTRPAEHRRAVVPAKWMDTR